MIATPGLTDSARIARNPAQEPAHLRDQVGDHRPDRGQRRQRDTEHEGDDQRVRAREYGYDQRPSEVAAECAVHDPCETVRGRTTHWRKEPPRPSDQRLAVEHHSERDCQDDQRGGDTADERVDGVTHGLVVDGRR